MKRVIATVLGVALLFPLSETVSAASTSTIGQIDIVTNQNGETMHPQQIAIERSLQAGTLRAERLRMAPVPTGQGAGLAQVVGSDSVYVADKGDGSIWQMDPDTGRVQRHFTPSSKPSKNMQGIATGLGNDIYVYYNGAGKIQRLHEDGSVVETFDAPTKDGHALLFKDNFLYVLDDRGQVYQIDASSKKLVKKIVLRAPDGNTFGANHTYSLMWDGNYFTIANAQDSWKLYRYTTDFTYHDKLNLQNGSIYGLVFNGKEYLALNTDNDRIFTIRLSDDLSGDTSVRETSHYQYEGNALTTTDAGNAFPLYPEHNVDLVFNDLKPVTADFLKPYVSYLDAYGTRRDKMFDTFLFLPTGIGAKRMFLNQTEPVEWTSYLKKTMQDLQSLDTEWGNRNRDLQLNDRAKVFLAVPYPDPNDDLSKRKAAVHAYLDQALSLYGAQHFSNLTFRGFYWYNEDANFAESLVVDFNAYVHRDGLITMWIPYHAAQEADDYNVLGFDEVFQQPNHFFKSDTVPNVNRFFDLTWTGIRYGKGVEMELDERALRSYSDPEYRQLFQDYLHYGLVEGFQGGSRAWYENSAVSLLYDARDPLYDAIHAALMNTYTEPQTRIVTPLAGSLTSTWSGALPVAAKLRIDLLASAPFDLQTVTVHTNAPIAPASYMGTLRVDEELVLKNGALVKQEVGQAGNDTLRIGFNVPITTPVQVNVLTAGSSSESPVVSGYGTVNNSGVTGGVNVNGGSSNNVSFTDLSNALPTKNSILALANQGIINGVTENGRHYFKPTGTITRAQFAVMLANAYHLKAAHRPTFADAKSSWYSDSVAAVTENGYMSGYDNNHFGPNDPINQEQVAMIVIRILHRANIRGDYQGIQIVNQTDIDDYAVDSVLEGKALELYSNLFGATAFRPHAQAMRGDVADVLYKTLQLK